MHSLRGPLPGQPCLGQRGNIVLAAFVRHLQCLTANVTHADGTTCHISGFTTEQSTLSNLPWDAAGHFKDTATLVASTMFGFISHYVKVVWHVCVPCLSCCWCYFFLSGQL